MSRRRIISVVLLAMYLIATGGNALGVMMCDCAAHVRNEASSGHDHSCCSGCSASVCAGSHSAVNLTEHCSCTHRHGESDPYTLSQNFDELLKYVKPFVGEALCADGSLCLTADAVVTAAIHARDRVPIVRPPLIPSGSPRAPSFS